jgi:hypothetical protein
VPIAIDPMSRQAVGQTNLQAMDAKQSLLAWQWEGYPQFHTTRSNLVIHALTAPLFPLGTLALVSSLPLRSPLAAAVGGGAMLLPLILQGRGHNGEPKPPIPFSSPFNFVARFFLEQWVNLPRFLLGGGFARAWRAAGSRAP